MALVYAVALARHVPSAAAWIGRGLPALSRAALAGGAPCGDRVAAAMTGSVLVLYAFAVFAAA